MMAAGTRASNQADACAPSPMGPVGGSRCGRAALASEVDRVEVAPVGDRHRCLFGAACALGELVAGGELEEEATCAELEQVGRLVGLSDSDVRGAVRAGMRRGSQRPRRAPEGGHKIADRLDAMLRTVRWFNAAMEDPAFQGRRGPTQLRILAGFAMKAISAGKVEVAESYREIAEAAGVSVGTVAKHITGLSAWVRRVRCGSVATGRSVWRLQVARAIGNNPTTSDLNASGLFPRAARARCGGGMRRPGIWVQLSVMSSRPGRAA
jgi:hypothetical protein